MDNSKEFQVEYTILRSNIRHGNFRVYGNPFDRETILALIISNASEQMEEPVKWTEIVEVVYHIKETARLLDNAWDNEHTGRATPQEILELLEQVGKLGNLSKLEKMRLMHQQNDG